MKDPILLNKLWKEVEAGRVTASQSGSLTVFKYTQDTHINGDWNEVNRLARGIIFDMDGTVVARPFSKFFNLNERPETEVKNLPWSEGVEIYEKLDGSCGAGYIHDDLWRLATPGSMQSDQAIRGSEMLYEMQGFAQRYKLEHLPPDCTPVFEIIYPENRIVVDYGSFEGLVLLAIFEHNGIEWHPRRVDQLADVCGFRRPKRYDIDLRGDIPFEDNHEGYVARFGDGTRVKVKSPAYLRIHRLLDRLSPKGVIELIRGKEYGAVVKQLPREIARDFDDVRAHVQGMHNNYITAAYARLNRLYDEVGHNAPRKEVAEWIITNVPKPETGFVFAILDDKDIEDKVWRLVEQKMKDEN